MPPLSPRPGWTNGEGWRERTARVRMGRRVRSATRPVRPGQHPSPAAYFGGSPGLHGGGPLGRYRLAIGIGRVGLVGGVGAGALVLDPERLVDVHEGLHLLLGEVESGR